jgi:xanthine phosphoribosyltransferase
MMELCSKRNATVVGIGIAIEKGFQPGGKKLREAGVHLKSLAIVDGIADGKLILREEE